MITPLDLLLSLVAGLSLAINAALYHLLKKSKKQRPLSRSAEELMHDLTAGVALVRIERVDPGDVFLRSPRT